MITCILVDDEPLAREELASMLTAYQDIQIIAQCGNAIEAIQLIIKHKPDLIFLDIQMPKISGMELIGMLDPEQMPKVIFITAFDEFAIKAFDNHAFDYLLKPIEESRLQQSIARLRKDLTPQAVHSIAPTQLNHLPCYTGNKLKVILVDEVEFVCSDVGGIHVTTAKETVHTQMTLKMLEEKTGLVRCHRQYLITPKAIAEIELLDSGAEVTTHSGAKVPVSRRYLKTLKQLFGFQ
ncbi:two-component system response regulator BtsR [Shewanella gelidii]|uniref:Response regulatory protein n=1 Tax=Shewanella gelidii TaxID=1642821 RepID=A0A917JNX5_9GAMM|nr:two-component system response regulator BtsR [Shewanella gelidii]MCL1097495.1 two-component system response regulator BtsR [Shewanella gelidii]GGI75690.1 putative response regulatory protein [Shewanella gelidii]